MLRILAIIFVCALGSSTGTRQGRCPPGHTRLMMDCIAPIQRIQSNPSQNMRQMCRTMNTGLDCLQDIMESCADQPDVAAMASMMNIDQIRSLVSSECSGRPAPTYQPGSNSNCPPGYAERIMDCVGPMQNIGQVTGHNIGHACGVVISGLGCLDNILENCAGEPEVQALTSMLHMDTMREMVHSQCASVGAGNNNNNDNGRCPSGHTQMMMECIAPIQRIQQHPPEHDRQVCGIMNTGLDCLEGIMDSCADQPDVTAMASMMNMDQVRLLISSQCSGGPMPTFQPGSNSNCPPGYQQRILDCVGPMQVVGAVTGNNIGQACGVVISGLECLDNTLESCAGEVEVQAISSMFNMDTMREMVLEQCASVGVGSNGTNNNDNCPSGYRDRLMECMGPMAELGTLAEQDINLACSVASDGLGCLDTIVSNCGDRPEVQTVVGMLELDEMRPMIESVCSGANLGNGGSQTHIDSNDNCPAGYETRLRDCAGPMQSIGSVTTQNLDHACSVAADGLGCLQTIIDNCGDRPDVQALARMVDIDEMRSMIDRACPISSGNMCADSSAELQRCNGILSSFQDTSRNMATRCRNLNRGFECFLDRISMCPSDPAVTAFTSVIDLGEAQRAVTAHCPSRK